jgi:hypothetical protein
LLRRLLLLEHPDLDADEAAGACEVGAVVARDSTPDGVAGVEKVPTSQKNCSVAFGLPKHSQPDDPTRAQRLRHHKIPPIAAVDAQTIAVGNLPIQFSWASKDLSSGDDRDCIRTTDQILQTLQSPVGI